VPEAETSRLNTRLNALAYRVSGFNRARKWDLFVREMQPRPDDRILDAGVSDAEWSATDNYLEKHYPWPSRIAGLGVEPLGDFARRYPTANAIRYDGRDFPFRDGAFDICWSNAVLEHVGTHRDRRESQVRFLREIARVAAAAFVTTPNRRFPVEVHTRTPLLHWLPKRWFDVYLRRRGQDWAAGDYMDLLTHGELRALLSDAGITEYRIIRNRLLGVTLDFAVIINGASRARPMPAA
jgi:SAM-dependent methyltransferase